MYTIALGSVIGAIIGSILFGTYLTGHQFSVTVWAIFGAIFGGGIGVFLGASGTLLGYVKHKVTWFPCSSSSRLCATPKAPAPSSGARGLPSTSGSSVKRATVRGRVDRVSGCKFC